MLIITGLGRCGTSVTALFLQKMGFNLGLQLSYDEEIRAGMELNPAYAINRDLYNDFISSNREIDLNEVIDTPYWGRISYKDRILRIDKDDVLDHPQDGKVEVIKDPRFTWHPKLIELWWEVRKDIKLLVLHRTIEDILKSRQQLDEAYHDPKRKDNLQEFFDDYEQFIIKIEEIKIPYKFWMYPDFLTQYEKAYAHLQELGIEFDFNKGKKVWEETIDLSLVASWEKSDMKEHPGSKELMETVADWHDGPLIFSKRFEWERWGLLAILSDFILHYTRGDIVEVGVCESSIFFTKLAKKYGRRVYHCDLQQSIITNCKTVDGYFDENNFVICADSDTFFREIDLPPIALGFIDGDHIYEQVRKDFDNLFPHIVDDGYIFLHDTYPKSEEWLGPTACGTVYKLRKELEGRNGIDVFTFTRSAWDVGLTMVRKHPKNLQSFQQKG